jgi:hypothetical protein
MDKYVVLQNKWVLTLFSTFFLNSIFRYVLFLIKIFIWLTRIIINSNKYRRNYKTFAVRLATDLSIFLLSKQDGVNFVQLDRLGFLVFKEIFWTVEFKIIIFKCLATLVTHSGVRIRYYYKQKIMRSFKCQIVEILWDLLFSFYTTFLIKQTCLIYYSYGWSRYIYIYYLLI